MQSKRRKAKQAARHARFLDKKRCLRERIQEVSRTLVKDVPLLLTIVLLFNLLEEKAQRRSKQVSQNGKEKLDLEERIQLYVLYSKGNSIREIARRLKRSPSTISRELKRNRPVWKIHGLAGYDLAKYAHDAAVRRSHVRHRKVRIKDGRVRDAIIQGLEKGLSPEKIAKRIFIELGLKISLETIYQWIYQENRVMIPKLPRGEKKYHRRTSEHKRRALRQPAAPKRSIDTRPKAVKNRSEFGHWEMDTIVSKQSKACLLVIQERVTRFFFVVKLSECSAAEAGKAVIQCLKPLGRDWVKSISCDNGAENQCHADISKELHIPVYFCHPYCSSERGGVENRNGTLRRYFPKKTNFSFISEDHLETVRQELLHSPMKCLDFFSPLEVFTGTFIPLFKEAA